MVRESYYYNILTLIITIEISVEYIQFLKNDIIECIKKENKNEPK